MFKPSLRPFGIDRPMYTPLDPACPLSPAQHQEVCTAVYDAVSFHGLCVYPYPCPCPCTRASRSLKG